MSVRLSQLQQSGAVNAHLVVVAEKQQVTEGVQAFEDFDNHANQLHIALRVFSSSIQLLSFSVGVMHPMYQLRKAIMRLQFHFRENAAWLYDDVKQNGERDVRNIKPDMIVDGEVYVPAPKISKPWKGPENVIGGMERLQKNIRAFIERVNEISAFQDELLNKSFLSFADDLKYRAEALGRYNSQLNTRSFKERVNKLTTGFSQHLEKMQGALNDFQKISLPIIQRDQELKSNGLQVLSAVATLFSGVTASTIQYQVEDTSGPLGSAVNGLWIVSLGCSIASAVTAQVAFQWRTSRFSTPEKYAPTVIIYILQYSPMLYLCCSVSTFMTGLSVFTFSSSQHIATSVITAVLTGTVSFQLVFCAIWFGLERICYWKTKGRQWVPQALGSQSRGWHNYATNGVSMFMSRFKARGRPRRPTIDREVGDTDGVGSQADQNIDPGEDKKQLSPRMREILQQIVELHKEEKRRALKEKYSPQSTSRRNSTYLSYSDKQAINLQLRAVEGKHNGLIKDLAFSPNGDFLATCGWDGRATISYTDERISLKQVLEHSQISGLTALGKRVTEELVREVAWSPDGLKLATRTKKTVRIWDMKDGACVQVLPHTYSVEAIAWTPDGGHIISVEHIPRDGSPTIVESTRIIRHRILEHNPRDQPAGSVSKDIEHVKVVGVALVDESTLIAVGSWVGEAGVGKTPETEKTLILFNPISGETLSTAPLSGEVRGLDITNPLKHIWSVLLTYKHENAPPALWSINMGARSKEFQFVRSYFAKASCSFSGRGCFGGPDNIYVCCSTQEGEIFIWNRDTGLLLHTIHPDNDEHIIFFACNKRDFPDFLVAAGAVDGTLSVWGSSRNETDETSTIINSPQSSYFRGRLSVPPRYLSTIPPTPRQSSPPTSLEA